MVQGDWAEFHRRALERVSAIAGVQSAAFASEMPMEGFDSDWDTIFIEGKPYHKGEIPPLHFCGLV